jgi:YihY family inner membrane protein
VLAKGDVKLGLAFATSFVLAVWSANGGMKAIIDALNVVYGENEKRGFLKLNAVSLAFTFGGLVGILIAIGCVVALPIVLSTIGLGSVSDALLRIGRWPALVAMMLLGLAVLYRYGPSRQSPQWRWLTVGSVLASVTWLAGSALLSFYLANYANYDATYGSLGAAIGLMMWMWMSTIVVLFGAELNSEIEHQTAMDSTGDGNNPLGARGAKVADTVGEAKNRGAVVNKAKPSVDLSAICGRAAPRNDLVAESKHSSPQFGEPIQHQQLWFDHSEQPFYEQKTGGISRNEHSGAGKPMALACHKQREQFQRLDQRQRHKKQRHWIDTVPGPGFGAAHEPTGSFLVGGCCLEESASDIPGWIVK